MTSYDKPHLTYIEQSALLKSRGLIANDEVYHIGASLKDLGKKWFAFSRIDRGSF